VRSEDWQKAIDQFTKAAAVENTAEVQAGLANAKKKLAEEAAAAGAKKEVAALVADAKAAEKAADWAKALDLYTKANEIASSKELLAGIARAKEKIADAAAAADKKKEYTKWMTDGDAAGAAGDWQEALDDYTKAAAIDNTAEAKAAIAKAKKKVAEGPPATGKKVDYASLMADGNAAGKAGDWQKALDLFTKAQGLQNTAEVRAAIANAKKKLAAGN
jgi:tetratricopeptide (TPR) repeat protein